MPVVSRSVLIRAPLPVVFAFVADYRNTTRFQRQFSRFEPVGEPTHGLGMKVDVWGHFKGFPVRTVLRVTEFVENKRIVSESTEGLRSRSEWRFLPEQEGTRVQFSATFEWPLLPPSKILERMAEEELAVLAECALGELKRLLEVH